MTRGFVTIATGDVRYYKMARTLLRSYRQNCGERMPFAVIADQRNTYTEEFDDVIVLDHANKNWMDKINVLTNCPYDETIFIDADCLIYRDINFLWDIFAEADDFSCFGQALPMDSTEGWFTKQAAEVFPIQFITHLHGILYFVRKGKVIDEMRDLCDTIISNYSKVTYKGFNERLADEPVFALAMAILGLKPVERKSDYYCFVPFATKCCTDYKTRSVRFENLKDGSVNRCCIVHWGNQNTYTAPYRIDTYAVNSLHKRTTVTPWLFASHKLWYHLCDKTRKLKKRISFLCKRIVQKLTGR